MCYNTIKTYYLRCEDKNMDKLKILIVDDSEINRMILSDMLESEYEIMEASNGLEALEIIKNNLSEISLILLDNVMPKMSGLDVLTVMSKEKWNEDIPVIMISVENTRHIVDEAYELGIVDYINQPFDLNTVIRRVKNTIMLYNKQKKLINIVEDQIYQKEKCNNLMVNILSNIVEFRNGESGLHVIHIRTITEFLLQKLSETNPELNINQNDISLIGMASSLHDIGKIAVPLKILNKPGRFTPEEFEIMKSHSIIGAEMLNEFNTQGEPLINLAYQICRWHHERYDGRGYPDGLKGDEIPISAQIVSIADVYDALTSERCYKKAFTHEKALEMINNNECGVFNPVILNCLNSIADELRDELKKRSISTEWFFSAESLTQNILKDNDIYVSIFPKLDNNSNNNNND